VEDFDLLVWWPPCQAYSTQGKRKWIEDPRWTLILDYLNVVKIKNPRYVILENVKWLVNFRKWEVYNFIKGTFDTLWYDVFTKVMNTRNYWLPQNRSRVIFVAIRKDLWSGSIFEFPKESILETTLFDFLDEEIDNETLYFSNERIQSMYSWTYQSENPQNINKYCYTLTHSWTPKRFFTWLNLNDYDVIHEKYKKRKLSQDELNDLKWRMLSPREYEKLQWFPIDWTLWPKTSRYNQIWNSISVPILEAIFRQFLNILH
jgi:DNA (cytosine-5)-methyltransferase 1